MSKAIVAAVLFAIGCGTNIRVTRLNWVGDRPPRPPESIQVFASGPPGDRPFVDVAYLEAEQEAFSGDNTHEFILKLRKIAANLRCDALVLGGVTHATVGNPLDPKVPVDRKGMTATCIVYTEGQFATTISRAAPPR
jgi:hypothetical protein